MIVLGHQILVDGLWNKFSDEDEFNEFVAEQRELNSDLTDEEFNDVFSPCECMVDTDTGEYKEYDR